MLDLHTHILPGMDDGARTVEDSLLLLLAQVQQGVDTVALTPHFYRSHEQTADFLARREVAWTRLRAAVDQRIHPDLILGAEVAWMPGMSDWPELDELCYENTKILLVELPNVHWDYEIFKQLYNLECKRGITPMIAHLDRYLLIQKRRTIDQLLEMGYPIQVSAGAFMHPLLKKSAYQLLEDNDAVLISDCHNLDKRKPNMSDALKVIEKKFGRETAVKAARLTDEALRD